MRSLACLILALTLAACNGNSGTAQQPRLDQFRGQWVVVNYWAQWCKPCIKEIPELNTLDRQFPAVTVLGVNYDGAQGEELQQQLDKLGVAFATLPADPADEIGIARPVVLPTTVILDPAGKLSATLVGPQTLASLAQATGQPYTDSMHPDATSTPDRTTQ